MELSVECLTSVLGELGGCPKLLYHVVAMLPKPFITNKIIAFTASNFSCFYHLLPLPTYRIRFILFHVF